MAATEQPGVGCKSLDGWLRRCTIRQDREKLSGRVEVDEFFIGCQKSGKRGRGAHEKTNQSSSKDNERLYGVHLVTSLIKRLIIGTFQGRFEAKYLQNYLDEYIFRFNRRKSKSIGKKFLRIVQEAVTSTKITYSEIKCDMDPISEYFATWAL